MVEYYITHIVLLSKLDKKNGRENKRVKKRLVSFNELG